jgi:hypothetical protein
VLTPLLYYNPAMGQYRRRLNISYPQDLILKCNRPKVIISTGSKMEVKKLKDKSNLP